MHLLMQMNYRGLAAQPTFTQESRSRAGFTHRVHRNQYPYHKKRVQSDLLQANQHHRGKSYLADYLGSLCSVIVIENQTAGMSA